MNTELREITRNLIREYYNRLPKKDINALAKFIYNRRMLRNNKAATVELPVLNRNAFSRAVFNIKRSMRSESNSSTRSEKPRRRLPKKPILKQKSRAGCYGGPPCIKCNHLRQYFNYFTGKRVCQKCKKQL